MEKPQTLGPGREVWPLMIYIHMCVCVYIYRERETDRQTERMKHLELRTFIHSEREKEIHGEFK